MTSKGKKRAIKLALMLIGAWLAWAGSVGPSIVVIHNDSDEVMTDVHLYGGGGRFGNGPWDSFPDSVKPGETVTVFLPQYSHECGLALNFTAAGVAYSEEANAYFPYGTGGTHTRFQFDHDNELSSIHLWIGWHWRRIV